MTTTPGVIYCTPDVRCGTYVDDPEEGADQCPEPSRFQVARSDHDLSFGENGGSAEACDTHLSETIAGMVAGDEGICAIVTVRWDLAPDRRTYPATGESVHAECPEGTR